MKNYNTFVAHKQIQNKDDFVNVIQYYRFLPHYTIIYEIGYNAFTFHSAFSGMSTLKKISFPKLSKISTTRKNMSIAIPSPVTGTSNCSVDFNRLFIRLPDSYEIVALGNTKSYFLPECNQNDKFKDQFNTSVIIDQIFPLATKKEKLEIYGYITAFMRNDMHFENVKLIESELKSQVTHNYESFLYDIEEDIKDYKVYKKQLKNGYYIEYHEHLNKNSSDKLVYVSSLNTADFVQTNENPISNKFLIYKDKELCLEILGSSESTKMATVAWVNGFTEIESIYLDPIECFRRIKSNCKDLTPIDQCKVFGYIQRFIKSKMKFENVKKK